MSQLGSPSSSSSSEAGSGVRAVILAPTRELAHQIHNECLKLAQKRKWRIVLFSKATAATLADKNVRSKVGESLFYATKMWPDVESYQTLSSVLPCDWLRLCSPETSSSTSMYISSSTPNELLLSTIFTVSVISYWTKQIECSTRSS